jgi:5-hydroxyisourate hydrolase-like protein (transthyretin family)
MFGPVINKKTKKPFKKINTELMRIQADTSKFVAERLGKKKYSLKSPFTDDEGNQLGIIVLPIRRKQNGDILETPTETGDSPQQ